VKHSLADISKPKELLGYMPGVMLKEGLERAYNYYLREYSSSVDTV